ncbi:DUF6090 family protein [Rasiella sp. SM2506]|uniref:DUF6090 family protein n=1 Tax=Rasiella sp. SM2506 TaxID=3423914 RepID=UPI003D78CD65
MIKLFRNIRKNLLSQGKTTKYFKYAIGEILLVVIGILIALQINNWNEARKDKKYLHTVYSQIQKDLKSDTVALSPVIEFYFDKSERLKDIIDRAIPKGYYDTITSTNYKQCLHCRSDVTDFQTFKNLDKGYQLLKAMNTEQNFETDSISLRIDTFYTEYNEFIMRSNNIFSDLAKDNLTSYQKYEWFVDWSAYIGRTYYDKEFLKYIFESEENRVKSAHYKIFTLWYLGNLRKYKKEATAMLLLLEEQIN